MSGTLHRYIGQRLGGKGQAGASTSGLVGMVGGGGATFVLSEETLLMEKSRNECLSQGDPERFWSLCQ